MSLKKRIEKSTIDGLICGISNQVVPTKPLTDLFLNAFELV